MISPEVSELLKLLVTIALGMVLGFMLGRYGFPFKDKIAKEMQNEQP